MLWYFPWIYTILNACDGVGKLPLVNCLIYAIFSRICQKMLKKTIDNFPYTKYNQLVMQLGISKKFSKK